LAVAVRRPEDFRFVSGKGRFTDDVKLSRLAHAAIARATRAHAISPRHAGDASGP
jgi:carbon-monoxide dehydrogenase large subunit